SGYPGEALARHEPMDTEWPMIAKPFRQPELAERLQSLLDGRADASRAKAARLDGDELTANGRDPRTAQPSVLEEGSSPSCTSAGAARTMDAIGLQPGHDRMAKARARRSVF